MTVHARGLRNNRGQALVEFALLLPVVLLILFGIVEFGRAWQTKQTLTDAAREAARVAVVGNDELTQDSVQARVDSIVKAAGISPGTVALTYPLGCRFTGCSPLLGTGETTAVTLTIANYQFAVIHRLVTLVTSNGVVSLSSTAQMRIE